MTHPLKQFNFCPKCGSNNFIENNEKSKRCTDCGFIYYFNSSAAVVAIIKNDNNEILVAKRAKEPAKGTFDLPGGFVDMYETAEQAVAREVLEETRLVIASAEYLFSIPNIYVYSGFEVHTVDMFFSCSVKDFSRLKAQDDVEELLFINKKQLNPNDFGLTSIRQGIEKMLNS
ncbi:MAG: NUDIX domain-containing protein [Dysgonamonadaceae bacterium]|jgi:mutator protein MutT|nr:NUDIX domain-containing protein [Dysgonamonadaceae bacterium]MDD3308537.1 NUDIX domain-containing protein [Dysgonamonadaceae bacterium]MDD3899938.1 NUDIX domain-containing protein [Dysgonamonadaceae bacterium]MDD4398703.1 NUDIX domain-containing protein [Dysgonamonadaceae bacterium]MEA5080542.1 NUDIX domain-containing protein [Dysgonamonadaceae bacterium]